MTRKLMFNDGSQMAISIEVVVAGNQAQTAQQRLLDFIEDELVNTVEATDNDDSDILEEDWLDEEELEEDWLDDDDLEEDWLDDDDNDLLDENDWDDDSSDGDDSWP